MDRSDDIGFLEKFRVKIDTYLFLGYAPPEKSKTDLAGDALLKMRRAEDHEFYRTLRREINQMKPRAKQLVTECNISAMVDQTSRNNMLGMPTIERFHMFDLITENRSELELQKATILDVIDQAIGALKHQPAVHHVEASPRLASAKNCVFISHSSMDQEVVSATRQAFVDLDVEPNLFEEKSPGGPPTKEIAKAVGEARALFVFFTFNSITGETRDWIVFELGAAVAQDVPIHAWKLKGVAKESLPRIVEQVTTYHDYDSSTQGILALTREVRSTAKSLPKMP